MKSTSFQKPSREYPLSLFGGRRGHPFPSENDLGSTYPSLRALLNHGKSLLQRVQKSGEGSRGSLP